MYLTLLHSKHAKEALWPPKQGEPGMVPMVYLAAHVFLHDGMFSSTTRDSTLDYINCIMTFAVRSLSAVCFNLTSLNFQTLPPIPGIWKVVSQSKSTSLSVCQFSISELRPVFPALVQSIHICSAPPFFPFCPHTHFSAWGAPVCHCLEFCHSCLPSPGGECFLKALADLLLITPSSSESWHLSWQGKIMPCLKSQFQPGISHH